jgi:hypothetical protein
LETNAKEEEEVETVEVAQSFTLEGADSEPDIMLEEFNTEVESERNAEKPDKATAAAMDEDTEANIGAEEKLETGVNSETDQELEVEAKTEEASTEAEEEEADPKLEVETKLEVVEKKEIELKTETDAQSESLIESAAEADFAVKTAGSDKCEENVMDTDEETVVDNVHAIKALEERCNDVTIRGTLDTTEKTGEVDAVSDLDAADGLPGVISSTNVEGGENNNIDVSPIEGLSEEVSSKEGAEPNESIEDPRGQSDPTEVPVNESSQLTISNTEESSDSAVALNEEPTCNSPDNFATSIQT